MKMPLDNHPTSLSYLNYTAVKPIFLAEAFNVLCNGLLLLKYLSYISINNNTGYNKYK